MPVQLIVFSLITLAYVALQSRRDSWPAALSRAGIRGTGARWYGIGLLVGLVGGGPALALSALLRSVADDPSLDLSGYAGWQLGLGTVVLVLLREAFYTNLGEELLFRGALGGWLMDRFGFALGNLLQAVCFLVPHLAILAAGPSLWPVLLLILAFGWVAGWLRHRSGSIVPGWIAHTVVDTLAVVPLLA
jgi:uncharacterized protein